MRRALAFVFVAVALLGVAADDDDEGEPELAEGGEEENLSPDHDDSGEGDAAAEAERAAAANIAGVMEAKGKEGEEEFTFVLDLTKDNFETTLKNHERVLVNFCDPRNEDCKRIHDDYVKASKLLKAEQLDTLAARVDATVDTDLAAQYNVKSYPSFKYFVKGKFDRDYDGKLDADGLSLWLKNKEDPPVKELKEEDLAEFLEEIEADNFALVAHIKKKSVRSKVFQKVVEETLTEWDVAKIKFAAVLLPKGADPKADAKLTMHRPGSRDPDPEKLEYKGVWSEEKILWWAQNCTYATLGNKFTRNKYAPMSMDVMGYGAAVVAVVADSTEIEGKARDEPLKPQVEEALLPFALEHSNWKFVSTDIEKLEDHELELLGVAYGTDPRIVVLHDRKKFQLTGAEDMKDPERIKEFLDNIKAKKETPFYKSAEPPDEGEEFDESGVLTLTGSTFEEWALDSKKDVVVLYYSDQCEHSKKLLPHWADLAKLGVKPGWKESGVVIAKMNVLQNECVEEMPHYPRMVLYPAVQSEKKMAKKEEYTGDRDATSLSEWVTSIAHNLQDDEDDEEEEAPKKKKRRKQKEDL